MPKRLSLLPALGLDELVAYHQDVTASLRLYFTPLAPNYTERFAGKTVREAEEEAIKQLELRIEESDVRSSFAVLTSLEAHFRIDFDCRCKERKKDDLSRYFRGVYKEYKERVRLEDHILTRVGKHILRYQEH